MTTFRSWLILLLTLMPGSLLAQFALKDQDPADLNKELSHWHLGPGSSQSNSYRPIKGYADRPDGANLSSVRVEWLSLARDPLGDHCKIRGKLTIPNGTATQPVNWLQGILVYLSSQPDAKPDWSQGIADADVGLVAITMPDGTFEATAHLREIESRRDREQTFQFGLALAKHDIYALDQRVEWNSKLPLITSSVSMLKVPPAPKLAPELELIHRANGWPTGKPTGVDLIRAVNALQKLGKQRALAKLEKYVELRGNDPSLADREVTFWIIRMLFEPIQSGDRIPVPGIGWYLIGHNEPDAPLWPLNPLETVGDVPFMVGTEYCFDGEYESPQLHLQKIRFPCVVREELMHPTIDPLSAAERILTSPKFKRLKDHDREQATKLIRFQALAMLPGLVQPMGKDRDDDDLNNDAEWAVRLAEVKELHITWEVASERFVQQKR
ncbi:MAG: hypothetical protein V4719_00050 [Planctomycetota bacterium]